MRGEGEASMTMALAKARKEEGGGVSKSMQKSNTGGVLVLAGWHTSSRHFTKLVHIFHSWRADFYLGGRT